MKITEIYKNAYNTIVEEKKKAIIEQLKKSKSKSLSFNYVLNQISKDLSNDARNYVADNELEESTKMFKSSFQMYEGDFNNQLNLVLENEIEKIYQKTPNEKDFKKFVEKIAKAEALNACSLYFSNNSSSINLMYDLGDYKQFILDKQIDPETHDELISKLYPEDKKTDNKRKRKDWSKEIKETNRFLETFSDNEKKLLLKAFYKLIESNFKNDAYKNFKDLIPITEFSKLVLIVSKLEEPEIFYKKSNQSSSTKKITKQYTNSEIQILNGLKDRLTKYKMNKTKDYISGLIAKR